MRFSLFPFLAFFLLFSFSCKKKSTDIEPEIISFSTDKSTYHQGDTILIHAELSDDHGLRSMAAYLSYDLSGEKIYVSEVNGGVSGTRFTADFELIADYADVISGKHELQLQVSDGENITRAFLNLDIIAKPKSYTGSFLPVKKAGGYDIHLLSNNGSDKLFKSLNYSRLFGGFSSGQLTLIDGANGIMESYDPDSASLNWTVNVAVGVSKLVNYYQYNPFNKKHYLALSDGYIRAFDRSGVSVMTSSKIPSGYSPKLFALSESFLLVYSESTVSNISHLEVYDAGSGTYRYALICPDTITSMTYLKNSRFAVLGKYKNGKRSLTIYDLNKEEQPEQDLISYDSYMDATGIDETHLICRTEQGLLNLTTASGSGQLLSAFSPVKAIQPDQQVLYYWRNGTLYQSSFQGSTFGSFPFGTEPEYIWPYWK